MDIGGYISRSVRSLGDSMLGWLSRNGVEVRIEYQAGDTYYQRVYAAQAQELLPEIPEDPNVSHNRAGTLIRFGAALGSAVLVGSAVVAAGLLLAAPDAAASFEAARGETRNCCTEEYIDSRCAGAEFRFEGNHGESCPICMESFTKGDQLLILPCLHKYHKGCVVPWLLKTANCSVCRFSILSDG